MKKLSKLIALVLSLCVALSLVAGCGGGESVGEIKGNYQEVEKVSAEDVAKANAALLAATDAESEIIDITGPKFGAELKTNIDLKVGSEFIDENNKTAKENYSVNGNAEIGLAATSDEEGNFASLAAKLKLNGKVNLPNSLFEEKGTGNREVSANEELYITAGAGLEDAYIYLNTEINGLPEKAEGETDIVGAIQGKKKISLTNLVGMIPDVIPMPELLSMPDMPDIDVSDILPDTITVETVQNILTMVDMKLSLDCSDGVKFKISTTDTTKDKVKVLLATGLKNPALSSLKIDKLNVNFYLQLDAEGHLIATAASAEVKIEVPAELAEGTKINIEGKVSVSINIGDIEVKVPEGIATDESYEEILPPEPDTGAGE